MKLGLRILQIVAGVSLCVSVFATDQKLSAKPHANATIQVDGPRPGYQGKIFFNAASPASEKGPSFAVADYKSENFKVSSEITDISSLSLSLKQTNAWFTKPGSVKFFFSTDTTTPLEEKLCPLKFDTKSLPFGLAKQLGTLYELGAVEFKGEKSEEDDEKGKEKTDTYTFKVKPELKAFLIKSLNDPKSTIRLVVAPNDEKVSSTWAGCEHRRVEGQILTFEVTTK